MCEWGYEGQIHPFEERAARLEDAGVPFWVCPGTSSWMSIAGRVDNMIENIRAAAAAGVAHGALPGSSSPTGVTWATTSSRAVSDPGFATAAAFGVVRRRRTLAPATLGEPGRRCWDVHCYDDPAGQTGRAVVALGQTYRMVAPRPPNMSALALPYFLPQWPMGKGVTDGLTTADLDAVTSLVDDTGDCAGRSPPVPGGPTPRSSSRKPTPPPPSSGAPPAPTTARLRVWPETG